MSFLPVWKMGSESCHGTKYCTVLYCTVLYLLPAAVSECMSPVKSPPLDAFFPPEPHFAVWYVCTHIHTHIRQPKPCRQSPLSSSCQPALAGQLARCQLQVTRGQVDRYRLPTTQPCRPARWADSLAPGSDVPTNHARSVLPQYQQRTVQYAISLTICQAKYGVQYIAAIYSTDPCLSSHKWTHSGLALPRR